MDFSPTMKPTGVAIMMINTRINGGPMKEIMRLFACMALAGTVHGEDLTYTIAGNSHLIDHPIAHMKGELDAKQVVISPGPISITGVSVAYESPTLKKVPDSMLCHAGLHLVFSKDRPSLGWSMILSQGKTDVHFPPGFGLAVPGGRSVNAYSMAVSPDFTGTSFSVIPKTTIRYTTDPAAVKPLYISWIMTSVTTVGPGVTVYKSAPFSVKRFNTTLHYANIHVHAYAKSVEIRDITENQRLFVFRVKTAPNGDVLDTPVFSSESGIVFFQNHQYEIVVTYDNRTSHPIDVMGIAYLYFLNKAGDFQPLAGAEVSHACH